MGNFGWIIRIGVLGFEVSLPICGCLAIFSGLKCLPPFVGVGLFDWGSKCLTAYVDVGFFD